MLDAMVAVLCEFYVTLCSTDRGLATELEKRTKYSLPVQLVAEVSRASCTEVSAAPSLSAASRLDANPRRRPPPPWWGRAVSLNELASLEKRGEGVALAVSRPRPGVPMAAVTPSPGFSSP